MDKETRQRLERLEYLVHEIISSPFKNVGINDKKAREYYNDLKDELEKRNELPRMKKIKQL